MDCVLEVREGGTEAVLAVRGEVDVDTAPQLEECIALLLKADVPRLVLDVREVGFMDSSGLYVLVRLSRQARGRTHLVIRNPGRHVAKLLTISRVERVIDVEWRPEQAIDVSDGALAPTEAPIIELRR